MAEVLYYAIPFFVLLLIAEALSFRDTQDDELIGYSSRDTRTSLILGTGNVIINAGWKFVVVALFALVYELTPLRLDSGDWWVWVLLFFADDSDDVFDGLAFCESNELDALGISSDGADAAGRAGQYIRNRQRGAGSHA